jgi:hypothetical protein
MIHFETSDILHDHERRRRLATSAMIDAICSQWPAQAALRDEANYLRELKDARRNTSNDIERDHLTNEIIASCERMYGLIDLLMGQMP